MIRLALVRKTKKKHKKATKVKIDFKCSAVLHFYSHCGRFICQLKTFFFNFFLLLHEEKKASLWVTICSNASVVPLNNFL